METTEREAARRLFVQATEELEDALPFALAGQSSALDREVCRAGVDRLRRTATRLTAIARRIELAAGAGDGTAVSVRP